MNGRKEMAEKLIENVKLIAAYIMETYMPRIMSDQFLKVSVGNLKYPLVAYGNGYCFLEDDDMCKPDVIRYFDNYVELCLHWKSVKEDLEVKCKRLEAINRIIYDFEI
jgi:hypothetical protein